MGAAIMAKSVEVQIAPDDLEFLKTNQYKLCFAKKVNNTYTVVWQAVMCIDVQNKRGTIVNGFGDGFPNVMSNLHWYDKHYDVNNLEVLHR